MDNDKKQFSQKLSADIIEKFDECLKLRNDQLSITGSTINKGELLEEMINDYYYEIQGKTKDVDTVNKIHKYVQDEVDINLNNVIKSLGTLNFNVLRLNKLADVWFRLSAGNHDELVNKRMAQQNNLTREQAEEAVANFIANGLNDSCPYVEAVDAELYDDGSENLDDK